MLTLRLAIIVITCLCAAMYIITPAVFAQSASTKKARAFLDAFTKKVRPLDVTANRAWWDAMMTGKKEAFALKEEAQNKLDALLSDKAQFAELKAIKEAGGIDDAVTKRAIDIVYLMCLEKQLDADLLKEMTKLGNEIEQIFTTFRAEITDEKGSVK